MKGSLFTLMFLMFLNGYSQTQQEMNQTAFESYKQADRELNLVYKRVVKEYQEDTLFIQKLRNAQRIWISHRDAELEMRYPAVNKRLEYGSVYSSCVSSFLKDLTIKRTATLRLFIEGIEEGYLCTGVIKSK